MPPPPTFCEAFWFWFKLGWINFGGPAGQIALMHQELVTRKSWIAEEVFWRGLNFCMLLPGPEAQQLATYLGWRLHGTKGAITAGFFFILPSVFVLLALSWLVVTHHQNLAIQGALYGIQPVVVALVLEALGKIGRRTLHHPILWGLAALAFGGLFFFQWPFPWVLAGAGLGGAWMQSRWPAIFKQAQRPHLSSIAIATPFFWTRAAKLVGLYALLWALPVGGIVIWQGQESTLSQLALFFTQAAFITFGGAYAVLSYLAEAAVTHYHWLSTEQMMHGLALAETTPGPLIMVTQYVGFLAGWQSPGELLPWVAALIGAFLTTYVTFLPCFFFILLGAPYLERWSAFPRWQAALQAMTAAIVGVILNLALFFGEHVLFPQGVWDGIAGFMVLLAWSFLKWTKLPVYLLIPFSALAGAFWTWSQA